MLTGNCGYVGLIVIGFMVQQSQGPRTNLHLLVDQTSNSMPNPTAGTTIDRATISLDSARRLKFESAVHGLRAERQPSPGGGS